MSKRHSYLTHCLSEHVQSVLIVLAPDPAGLHPALTAAGETQLVGALSRIPPSYFWDPGG